MKFKTLILALATLFAFDASASVEPTISSSATSFIVDLNDWAVSDAKVEITDIYGEVLLSDVIRDEPARKYNLKNLNDGVYSVAVSNDLKVMETNISIDKHAVAVGETKVIFKPILKVSENFIDLNVLPQGYAVEVAFYDTEGEIFSKKYVDTNSINQRFSIEGLPAGTYTVSVAKGAIRKYETITKK